MTPTGFTEGPPQAYRPIACRIVGQDGKPVFNNHFAYQRVPLSEAGIRVDQREEIRHE